MGEKEKMLRISIFSFSNIISYPLKDKYYYLRKKNFFFLHERWPYDGFKCFHSPASPKACIVYTCDEV